MTYTEELTVPFFLGTQTGNLSLANMANIMLLVSENQLDQVDAGIAGLAKHGAGWVITQYHIDVARMPRIDEHLVAGTEATSYNKLMTYREYWLADDAGHHLVTMRGAWVMMDLATRKIIPIIPAFAEKVGAHFDSKVERFPRLVKQSEFTKTAAYRVRYFDIDGNGHVNNAHYMEWMEDVLGEAFLLTHKLVEADIKYAREVAYGTMVDSAVRVDGDTSYHLISTDGLANAEAKLRWEKKA